MPSKWLSRRHAHLPLHDHSSPEPKARSQQDFDFAFTEPHSKVASVPGRTGPTRTTKPAEIRPTTSVAGGPTEKKTLQVEISSTRPRTSENHKPSPIRAPNAITRADDSLIGLAFGSPSHPPASFCTPKIEPAPLEPNSTIRLHSPFQDKSTPMQTKKWKKLGGMFKSREAAVRRGDVPPGPTIGLPTGLVVLDKSPTSQGKQLEEHKLRPIQPDPPRRDDLPPSTEKKPPSDPKVLEKPTTTEPEEESISRPSTATDISLYIAPHTRPPLPKLELEIPTASLDRYSVMFRNLPEATRSSSLLARRSKTLDSLKSLEDSRPTSKDGEDGIPHSATEPLTPLLPPRRLTTPAVTKSPAGSKYSLFPPTVQTPLKITGPVTISESDSRGLGQLKRSATSPARLSPMRDFFVVPKPEPLNYKRTMANEPVGAGKWFQEEPVNFQTSHEQNVNSPDDKTASTDREAPWSSAHSFQSSISSATTVDEIFFDIKSFRDSKGVEDGQFVMTRPASAAVEFARTRSKRAAAMPQRRRPSQSSDGGESTTSMPPPMPSMTMTVTSADTTKHTSVNTAYFDEAIAAVERLTSPMAAGKTGTDPPSNSTVPVVAVVGCSDDKTTPKATLVKSTSSAEHQFTRHTNRSREDIGPLIPSPVTEVKEELSSKAASASPTTDVTQSAPPNTHTEEQTKKVVSPRVGAVKQVDRPIDDSPTIPQGPPSPRRAAIKPSPLSPTIEKPPPVPKKDAKYIPLSRYAAKSTVSKIEQAGIIPTRPVRANTDINLNPDLNQSPRTASPLNKERSATLPSSLHPPPRPPTDAPSPSSALRGLEKAVPPPTSRPNLHPTPPVAVKAEVAVARTVSLSRKQSARVLVPGPKLAARRAKTAPQAEQEEPQQQRPKRTEQEQKSTPGHHHRRTGSKSLSKDRINLKFLTRGDQPDSEKDKDKDNKRETDKEKEKERARLKIEQHVSIKGKAKDKAKEKEREKAKEVPTVTRKYNYDTGDVLDTRQWEVLDKTKWEILEKKSYSPVVVQAERGHRPGLSVGLVVETV